MSVDHVDCIEKLLKAIEIQLVFHCYPVGRSMAFIDASDEEQTVLCNILINIRFGKIDSGSSFLL